MTDWMEIISNTKIAQDVYEMKLKGQGAGKITAICQYQSIHA